MPKMDDWSGKVQDNVQTMVGVLEVVTFATAMAIAWFVWRISKRDSENKKSKPGNSSGRVGH